MIDDERGLVSGAWQADRALETSLIKVKDSLHPAGVLLGDGSTVLCGVNVYSSHVLSLGLVQDALDSSKGQRPSRGSGGAGDDKRGGLATFRRGAHVVSTGPAGADGPAEETVFGVMSFAHRKQQHRYVITYDEQM